MAGASDASLTVFFALVTTIVFALVLALLESARTEAGRLSLTIAVNSSIDSLFSQYHRKLWEDYRILGLEYYSVSQLSDEMQEFMEPYLEADNWFPARIESIDISDLEVLTGDNGEVFENEVMDYMKYGIIAEIWDMADINIFDQGLTEGYAVDDISGLYDDHTAEASAVELVLEDIASVIEESEAEVSSAASGASAFDGSAFISHAENAISVLGRIPALVESYESKADALAESLAASRAELEQKKASGEISDSVWAGLDSDAAEYESYADADGERRQQITALTERSESDIAFLRELIAEAEEIMAYIASWEPEDEDDELDEAALWHGLVSSLSGYDHLDMGISYGIEDRETQAKLESAASRLKSELLSFVLPDGAEVSTEAMELDEAPSAIHSSNTEESRLGLLDRVYMAFYTGSEMNYFGRGIYDDESAKGLGGCEQEYILFGKDNDTDNLTAAVEALAAIRTGLNLAYLYTDTARRNEALTLAASILGPAGVTPLTTVLQFFIISTWALGQAVMDVRHLLAGGRVPFIHNSESFDLTLEGLLRLSAGSAADEDSGSGDTGLCYSDYLKILLFTTQTSTSDYRCMDIMHINIRAAQSDFSMERLARSLRADAVIYTAHLFSELGPVRAFDSSGSSAGSYQMHISTSYSY